MMVSIYKDSDSRCDCTNGGASSKATRAFVILPGYKAEQQGPGGEVPTFILESHVRGCVRVAPLERPGNANGPMFGGNFVHTSDSRFWDAVQKLAGYRMYGAVAIHDRFEYQN